MSQYAYRLDWFSGDVADLKPKQRTDESILRALLRNPRVSVWDMDKAWIRDALRSLERRRLIAEQQEPYPWLRFHLTAEGRAVCHAAIEQQVGAKL